MLAAPVIRQWSVLVESGHKNIAIHLALVAGLAPVEGERGSIPSWHANGGTVIVTASGLYRTHLEEGPRTHSAVRMCEVAVAIHTGSTGRRDMERSSGRTPIYGSPVRTVNLEGLHRSGRDTETLIEFSENVVVDERQAGVFVVPALPSFRIHLP